MVEQLKLLADYWIRPRVAASHTIDHGRLGIAAAMALAVALLLQAPSRGVPDEAIAIRAVLHRLDAVAASRELTPIEKQDMAALTERLALLGKADPFSGISRAAAIAPANSIRWLVLLAIVFTPLSIAFLSTWEGLPRTGMSVRENYAGLLCCLLLAFTATHLPAAMVGSIRPNAIVDLAAHAWFLLLAAFSLVAVVGGGLPGAIGSAIAASAVSAGAARFAAATGLQYMLASPFVLFLLWAALRGEWSRLGAGLGQQQSFRRHLEALTLNPRDADAHYQIGLLYLQRRDPAKAADRFRQAAEIDPADADYAFQYGRALRAQDRHEAALEWLRKAASLDDKTASSEVWREIGAVLLSLDQPAAAVPALSKYVERREYDPEGLVLFGRALEQLARPDEARDAFAQAIEAVKTMPDHRRRQLRQWADAAKQGLSRLGR
ncbi:MAG: tetratricopeptide repeat protein [Bryobacteraceae bacterium]